MSVKQRAINKLGHFQKSIAEIAKPDTPDRFLDLLQGLVDKLHAMQQDVIANWPERLNDAPDGPARIVVKRAAAPAPKPVQTYKVGNEILTQAQMIERGLMVDPDLEPPRADGGF